MSPRNIVLAALIAAAAFGPAALPAQPQPAQSRPATILLVGASGMIGSRILTEAAGRGHPVLAAARHPERIASGANIRAVQLDATDAQAFINLARQADVIVTATSPREYLVRRCDHLRHTANSHAPITAWPDNDTMTAWHRIGEFGALLVIVSVPVTLPAALGSKFTV